MRDPKNIKYVARAKDYTEMGRADTREEAAKLFGTVVDIPKIASAKAPTSEARIEDRLPKAESLVSKKKYPKKGLAENIANMHFRDYGSWSASGKHLSAGKREKLIKK